MKGPYETKSIYIITNDINDKVYIGQSNNIKERWHKYKSESKKRPNLQLITKAMHKYGFEHFSINCLEENVENYDEREKYWIAKYNSQTPNGYNLAIGGEGNGAGINCISAKIKSEEQLLEIYQLLEKNELSMEEIGKQVGLHQVTISEINRGRSYYNPAINYPIRPFIKYSQELVDKIIAALQENNNKNFQQLAKELGIDCSQLSEINTGKIYYNPNLNYPIRVSKEERLRRILPEIINELKIGQLTQNEIAKKFNITNQTVSNINLGLCWKDTAEVYPIRSNYQRKKINVTALVA